MAGLLTRTAGDFGVTPHKISVCILLHQIYAPSAQMSLPFPLSSVSHHNRLGLYLLSLTKACDDMYEMKLEELINQLRDVGEEMDVWLTEHLSDRFSSLSSPDDLLNFFTDMRGILGRFDSGAVQDDQIVLDPNSNLGNVCSSLEFVIFFQALKPTAEREEAAALFKKHITALENPQDVEPNIA